MSAPVYQTIAVSPPSQSAGDTVVSVDWNGIPFLPSITTVRDNRTTRTRHHPFPKKRDPPAAAADEPITRETRIEMVSAETTLTIISTAPEAFYDLPDSIHTEYRGIGTFFDATATWRGHTERAFVSASVTQARIATTPGPEAGASVVKALAAQVRLMRGALRTGIILDSERITKGMTPDDIELVNLLIMYRDEASRTPFTYDDLGTALETSRESVRRRHERLIIRFPHIETFINSFRARNAKAPNMPPPAPDRDDPEHGDKDELDP